jgi:hypothetical protein
VLCAASQETAPSGDGAVTVAAERDEVPLVVAAAVRDAEHVVHFEIPRAAALDAGVGVSLADLGGQVRRGRSRRDGGGLVYRHPSQLDDGCRPFSPSASRSLLEK